MQINKSLKQKGLSYLLFWAVSFYIGLEVFSYRDEYQTIDVIYNFLFHIPLVYAVSLHSFHLIPNFLAKSKFWIYGLLLILGLYGSTIPLYTLTFDVFAGWLFPDYYLVGVFTRLEFVGIVTLYLILSSSLEFAQTWFSSLKAKNRIIELESQKAASELKVLRAQVNPHFLFNSLNTIYNEALKKSDKAPAMILKLSDLLRYVLDKMEEDRVPLAEELSYLQNYVDMQLERLNNPEKVSFTVKGDPGSMKIAPLLLINFVENAFKHADLQSKDGLVTIDINIERGSLELNSKNKIRDRSLEVDRGNNGLGIENARRRLELSYPKKHTLEITNNNQKYSIHLYMELDQ